MELQLQNSFKSLPLTGILSYDTAIASFNKNTYTGITAETLFNYISELTLKGYKYSTINHKISAIKKSLKLFAENCSADTSFFKYKVDMLFKSPEIKPVKVDRSISEEDVLSKNDLNQIINNSSEKTSLLIQALYQTALRVSELVNIKLKDCKMNKTNEAVEIIIIGKGKKQRTVFMTLELFQKIRNVYNGNIYLFESKTHKKLNRINVYKQIRRAAESAGFEGVHPHMIRHSWATNNLERLGIHKVSKYLGHSSIAITSE